MWRFLEKVPEAPRNYTACSGCGLCLLVCPTWRNSHNPRMSPEYIAKAMQCGATATELAEQLQTCCLCGACLPVCPERINLPELILDLRRQSPRPAMDCALDTRLQWCTPATIGHASSAESTAKLLPGKNLRTHGPTLAIVQALLGIACVNDDGDDILQALESGIEIPQQRLLSFLAPLRDRPLIVAEGLMLHHLRNWLPKQELASLGEAMSKNKSVRHTLRNSDLYVIEPRAYHSDYERLVKHYDRLQVEIGCALNLDLQRIAIPVAEQSEWILQGRNAARIVCESLADCTAFANTHGIPVVHIVDLVTA